MDAFIKKHEFNYIRKCLTDLSNAFTGCIDANIIDVTKAYTQEKILNIFSDLSEEQRSLLSIGNITNSSHIDAFLAELNDYVSGMPTITNSQLNKLFKKEKKLKLPDGNLYTSKKVYLGWVDEAVGKLFVAYNLNGKLVGMACRITNHTSGNAHRCVLCNRVGKEHEVAFVSPICKTANAGDGAYRSIGFNLCLDSEKCNERITATDKLEKILKDVNNIKD